MKLDRVVDLLCEISTKRVLVIGDLMLDEFVWGRVSRISPEAPVPVVEVIRESYYPGGAANVAHGARSTNISCSICTCMMYMIALFAFRRSRFTGRSQLEPGSRASRRAVR